MILVLRPSPPSRRPLNNERKLPAPTTARERNHTRHTQARRAEAPQREHNLRKRTTILYTYLTHTRPHQPIIPTYKTYHPTQLHQQTRHNIQQQGTATPTVPQTCPQDPEHTHLSTNNENTIHLHLRLRRGRERRRRFMNNFDFTLNQRSPRNTV